MSINNSYGIQIIESDGETTRYNFNFFIFKKEDLKIKVMDDKANITELEYNNDYTVENSFDYYNGGYFNLNVPQKKGLYMVIYRETPINQQINFMSLQAISPMNLTKMFDKLTVICQELNEQFYRSMKFDFTDISIIDQNKPLNETNIKNVDTADNKNLTVAIVLKYNEETNKWELSTSRTNPVETRDQGTEDMYGVYKIASQEEVNTGEDDTKVITPLKLENKINDKINTYTQQTIIPNTIFQYEETFSYSIGQPCYTIVNNEPIFYYSIKNDNIGNNPTEDTEGEHWKQLKFGGNGASIPLGSLITTTIPVIDPNLHLPDGTQITKTGGHKEFYFYMESIKDTHPEIFCSLAEYDKDVKKTGNCGKYGLYDNYYKFNSDDNNVSLYTNLLNQGAVEIYNKNDDNTFTLGKELIFDDWRTPIFTSNNQSNYTIESPLGDNTYKIMSDTLQALAVGHWADFYLKLTVNDENVSKLILNSYTIRGDNTDNDGQCPTDWTFEGSNDDENWIVLDERNNIKWNTASLIEQTFTFENNNTYKYYRFKSTAGIEYNNNGFISYFKFYGKEIANIKEGIINEDNELILTDNIAEPSLNTTFNYTSENEKIYLDYIKLPTINNTDELFNYIVIGNGIEESKEEINFIAGNLEKETQRFIENTTEQQNNFIEENTKKINDYINSLVPSAIQNYLIPDYNSAIDIKANLTSGYVAPVNGVININCQTTGGGNNHLFLYVNDLSILESHFTDGVPIVSGQVIVKKGDNIRLKNDGVSAIYYMTNTFCPFRTVIDTNNNNN